MKPILFSTAMVRAILTGQKTMTRRVCKPLTLNYPAHAYLNETPEQWLARWNHKPPYKPGDILWVRETWYYEEHMHDLTAGEPDLPGGRYSHRYIYRASSPDYPVNVGVGEHGWRPSVFMLREAARIFLKVTEVRVERVQEILCGDMKREGCIPAIVTGGQWQQWQRDYWIPLWDSINAKRGYGWDKNPWVWAISFERIEKPEVQ